MRRPFVAGNWKMNLDRSQARELVTGLAAACASLPDRDVGVFPPFTMLAEVAELARGSRLIVGAQNCHEAASGAYTGEVSTSMLVDAGATHVILGHSERRALFGERDGWLNRKLAAALDRGLKPIYCVGETLEERDSQKTMTVVLEQLRGGIDSFSAADLAHLTVAYEPVWAIGTGRVATPAQAVEVHAAIRSFIAEQLGAEFAAALRIQYGGSVKPNNAASLLGETEIDGALVGGASLELDSFVAIARSAA